ncbi:MAG: conjugal transfer protein TraR [Bacteroidetes bacterium]|nr:MAG: conjugal transfer protein TraR [Bacteroidota bacterium]MBL1145347.1 conjugal transfer protein TraR [Bacteroidota bacterium]MCB0801878.1 TraR/DksA family transcriptional regulator [Flavobacteriales bacterium]NOG58145.1 conjugal transfer protein TraR [Bacteroidota bacterium]
MKEAERKELKEKIIATIQILKADIEALKELVRPIAPENAIGRISRMDAINNKSINEAALRKASLRYAALKEALQKIDDADFGICANCRHVIPIGRLLLRPQSRSCVKCAY